MKTLTATESQRRLFFFGAVLFAVGLWTGIWSSMAMTGVIKVGIPRLALVAHLNALLGGLWIMAVAASLTYLNYSSIQLNRLATLTLIPAFGNWVVTMAASFLGVNGLTYTSDPRNNAIAFSLQLIVVIPSLVASVYWVRGFIGKRLREGKNESVYRPESRKAARNSR